jgi:hypothetical protein
VEDVLQVVEDPSGNRNDRAPVGLRTGGGANTNPDKEKAQMRSRTLTSATAAAAALLVLVPAGAVAHNRRTHVKNHANHAVKSGSCKVLLNVAPRLITAGESALAFGQESCAAPGTAAKQPVTVYDRPAGAPGFSTLGTTTTDEEGRFQLLTGALTKNTVLYAAIGTARSAPRGVKVAALVTLTGPPETKTLFSGIQTGRRHGVTFEGSVSPEDAGALVTLQRENSVKGTEWRRIAKPVLVDQNGHFSITKAFVAPGPSSIRVVVHGNRRNPASDRNVASASNVLSYVISQAQNPSLTIESSQDPLPYGSTAAIGGTVAGEPNTAVTLLARRPHGHFAPVATGTTDPAGKYTFAPQKPLASTFYRVTAGGRNSAVLYEGVKYVLTAEPSATSLLSGQPFTYSGTVTPAKAGHAIYIEKLNPAGTNFHVVAVGTVAADGTYSITRSFYAPGSYTLRVKIPGDSENGGAASAPSTISVNPISNAKIPAEPPVNGGLPPAGQL